MKKLFWKYYMGIKLLKTYKEHAALIERMCYGFYKNKIDKPTICTYERKYLRIIQQREELKYQLFGNIAYLIN